MPLNSPCTKFSEQNGGHGYVKDTTSINGTCVFVSMPSVGCVSQAGLAYLGRNHNLSAESSEFGFRLKDVMQNQTRQWL